MKIGVDISVLTNEMTGVGKWTYFTFKELIKLDIDNNYIFYSNRIISKEVDFIKRVNLKVIKLPPKIRPFLWYYYYLPRLIREDNIEIFISPSFFLPILPSNVKSITVVHDITPIKFPRLHTFSTRIAFKIFLKFSLKRASKIVADSENTKNDLVRFLDINEEKIKVIYPGIDDVYFKNQSILTEQEVYRVMFKYNIPKKFILYVGTIEPRKNLIALLKVFEELKEEKSIPHKLIIVGKKGWHYDSFYDLLSKSKYVNEIILTGYVPEEDLRVLYSYADVFVYPSLYEGFGLPPLEAMAHGCPVVTSNVSSLPEVVGDAGLLVDPNNYKSIKDAIIAILENEKLREDLVKKGIQRAKQFTWKKTASELKSLIYELTL